jgi:hypothetical protein
MCAGAGVEVAAAVGVADQPAVLCKGGEAMDGLVMAAGRTHTSSLAGGLPAAPIGGGGVASAPGAGGPATAAAAAAAGSGASRVVPTRLTDSRPG